MLILDCPFCKARSQAAISDARRACPDCGRDATPPSSAAGLPQYASYGMLPGARQAKEDDDDTEDDERPRPKKKPTTSGMGTAAAAGGAAAGLGIGMILAIVGGLVGCCLCLPAILVGLSVPMVQKVREAAARAQSVNNAREIALACHTHYDATRRMPTPKMEPQPGAPVADLSWRVAILPYMRNPGGLFERFDKQQHWDSDKNKPLLSPMPVQYNSAQEPGGTQTKYQYFTGADTLFPKAMVSSCNFSNIPDGKSNTFLLAEAAAAVPWSKPADMEIGGGALPLPSGIFVAAMADGAGRIIDRSRVNDEVLRQLIHPTDNKPGPGWER